MDTCVGPLQGIIYQNASHKNKYYFFISAFEEFVKYVLLLFIYLDYSNRNKYTESLSKGKALDVILQKINNFNQSKGFGVRIMYGNLSSWAWYKMF